MLKPIRTKINANVFSFWLFVAMVSSNCTQRTVPLVAPQVQPVANPEPLLDFYDSTADALFLFSSLSNAKQLVGEVLPWAAYLFDVEEGRLRRYIENIIGLELWGTAQIPQGFMDAPLLVTAKDSGFTFSFRWNNPEHIDAWYKRFRDRHVAQHPDALGIDQQTIDGVDVRRVLGNDFDFSWMVSGAWLHVRLGGASSIKAWARLFSGNTASRPHEAPKKSLDALLQKNTARLVMSGDGAKKLVETSCSKQLLARFRRYELDFKRAQHQWDVELEFFWAGSQGEREALLKHSAQSHGFDELRRSSNLTVSSNVDVSPWLKLLPCVKLPVAKSYLPASFAIGIRDWLPRQNIQDMAALFVETASRPLAKKLSQIPLRRLFEKSISIEGEDWRRLSIPTQPSFYYSFTDLAGKAASTLRMAEIVSSAGLTASSFNLSVTMVPNGFADLTGSLLEFRRLLGGSIDLDAERLASLLLKYRLLHLQVSANSNNALHVKLTWENN